MAIVKSLCDKPNKTVLQRIARLSKSFLQCEDVEYGQYSLRELISHANDDYWESQKPLLQSGHSLPEDRIVPIGTVISWSEEIDSSVVSIQLDDEVFHDLSVIQAVMPLEGHHLTINGERKFSNLDQPTKFGTIALGLVLTHIILVSKYDGNLFRVYSDNIQRFINPGEDIVTCVYLIDTTKFEKDDVTFWTDDVRLTTNDVYTVKFTNRGIIVSSGSVKSKSKDEDRGKTEFKTRLDK